MLVPCYAQAAVEVFAVSTPMQSHQQLWPFVSLQCLYCVTVQAICSNQLIWAARGSYRNKVYIQHLVEGCTHP